MQQVGLGVGGEYEHFLSWASQMEAHAYLLPSVSMNFFHTF